MSGSQHHEIVVAGGGHAGLFAALALVQAGFEDVVVVDPAGPGALAPTGRSLALLAGSKAILERHGVWKLVRDRGHPVWRVDVAGAGAGRVIYDAAEIGVEALAWGFVNERLRDGLASAWSRLRGPAGWLTGSVIAMEAGNPRRLVLEEGTLKADLVIAADGRNSALRRMAGIGSSRRTYDQAALSFVVEHEHDNRATVLERLRPSGPVATLPLGARRTGITWVDRRARCEALGANEGEALMADLSQLVGDQLGDMRRVSPIQCYPLGAHHASRYALPRLALLGDAAHGVHPIHAQGFNMGIGDVDVLVAELAAARARGRAPGGEALRRYERKRMAANAERLRMTDGLNRLFSNDLLPLEPARRAVLGALASSSWLRRRAIRHGMQVAS